MTGEKEKVLIMVRELKANVTLKALTYSRHLTLGLSVHVVDYGCFETRVSLIH